MKLVKALLALAALSGLSIACGHQKVQVDSDSRFVEKKGVFSMSVWWVKLKEKKFDTRVTFKNESSASEIVWLKDIECSRGQKKGEISMEGSRHGDYAISLRPGTQQTYIFTCDLNAFNVKGSFRLNVSRVFNNPTDDGRTGDKVIAKDLTFDQSDNGDM